MAATTFRGSVPAFLSIDVEPEAFQLDRDASPTWSGFAATLDVATSLRDRLAARSGYAPQFGWYFRTDPQVRQAYGRADAAMAEFADEIRRLRAWGDYFGVHMHPLRWSDAHGQWIHDFADRAWLRECTHASLDAFEAWNRAPAKRFRSGAGFLNDDILDVLEQRGVAVEMSLEPVASWGLAASVVPSGIDTSPIVGSFVNCDHAPAVPYCPARDDFRREGGRNARSLLLVPLSSGSYSLPRPGWWPSAKRALRRFGRPWQRHMYFPTSAWPSPRYFWDLVEHTLATMRRPYVSLALRTDRPGSAPDLGVRAMLGALTVHPLAERLRFVDPLAVMDALTPRVPKAVAARAASATPPRAAFAGAALPR